MIYDQIVFQNNEGSVSQRDTRSVFNRVCGYHVCHLGRDLGFGTCAWLKLAAKIQFDNDNPALSA